MQHPPTYTGARDACGSIAVYICTCGSLLRAEERYALAGGREAEGERERRNSCGIHRAIRPKQRRVRFFSELTRHKLICDPDPPYPLLYVCVCVCVHARARAVCAKAELSS